jgi:hypothetical protein
MCHYDEHYVTNWQEWLSKWDFHVCTCQYRHKRRCWNWNTNLWPIEVSRMPGYTSSSETLTKWYELSPLCCPLALMFYDLSMTLTVWGSHNTDPSCPQDNFRIPRTATIGCTCFSSCHAFDVATVLYKVFTSCPPLMKPLPFQVMPFFVLIDICKSLHPHASSHAWWHFLVLGVRNILEPSSLLHIWELAARHWLCED